MIVRWTAARLEHVAHRSDRYVDAADIDPAWAKETVADPRALVRDPDSRS